MKSQTRRRVIFEVPVYRSEVAVSGHFVPAQTETIARASDRILWSEAVLAGLVQEVRGIRETTALTIDGVTEQGSGPGSVKIR